MDDIQVHPVPLPSTFLMVKAMQSTIQDTTKMVEIIEFIKSKPQFRFEWDKSNSKYFQVQYHAVLALKHYDLHDWSFKMKDDMRVKSYLGLCSAAKKTITLTRRHIEHHTFIELQDTILHEVAHALCPRHWEHGVCWQNVAMALSVDISDYKHIKTLK